MGVVIRAKLDMAVQRTMRIVLLPLMNMWTQRGSSLPGFSQRSRADVPRRKSWQSASGSGSGSFHARPRGVCCKVRGTLISAAWAGFAGRLRGGW